MCAARKKGKWVDGHPVLGYDIDTRGSRFVVNADDLREIAATVYWMEQRKLWPRKSVPSAI